jgi:parallel beta-helix repeat protein
MFVLPAVRDIVSRGLNAMFDRRTIVVSLLALTAGCSNQDGLPDTEATPGPNPTPKVTAAPAATVIKISPGPKVQEEALTALIKAKPGDTIEFTEGTFHFTMGLSLAVEKVTIRGQGMDKTILSFAKQNAGKEGLLVTRGQFVIEDLTVEDTKGDAIKVNDAEGVTFRRVRARWTGGSKESNGAYGLYPVQCKNVLIDGCVAIAASDAGIYVGQSKNIVVRNCRAEQNVAGIEIENSIDADVYNNVATENAGGLLVFDLPGLQLKNGKRVRVFKNQVFANNHANFAPKGNIVAEVAPGTGMMVMATDQVEVFENTIRDNNTYNFAVVSFYITGKPIEDKDKDYDPIPEGIFVHDNTFAGGGTKPGGARGQLLELLLGKPIPDIIYDGITPAKNSDGKPVIYLKNNGEATFANLMWAEMPDLKASKSMEETIAKIMSHKGKVKRDIKTYEGELPRLSAVKLP